MTQIDALKRLLRLLVVLLLPSPSSVVAASGGELVRHEWTVDGVKREGLLRVPADHGGRPLPVLFAFHGHGGGMRQAANSFRFHEHWPQALVVYLQGLPTPGRLTDPEGRRNGWQAGPGEQGDRDLKFFDTVLSALRRDNKIDPQRIYATGHSNGGSFTYLLWAKRGEVFAAYGPSGAAAGRRFGTLRPSPVIHVAGENDELVKFAWQKVMIGVLLRTNQCGTGKLVGQGHTLYESKVGAPVMTAIHPGGHKYLPESSAWIVAFFQAHPKRR